MEHADLTLEQRSRVLRTAGFEPVPGYEMLVSVDRGGKVYLVSEGRLLPQYSNTCGYQQVNFIHQGRRVYRLVHRLMAETFIPNPAGKPHVAHGDDNPRNNALWNLRWATEEENAADKRRNRQFA